MLPEIHNALQRLIHDQGRISPFEVDVRFEMPTKEWLGRLTRPTVVFFLFDLAENIELRRNDFQQTRGNGRAERRLPPRRIDLHYLVSAVTTDAADEHRLLWRTLETLLRHQQLPDAVLPDALRALDPPLTTRIAPPDAGPRTLDLWNALGAEPRPALSYIVTAPLDLELAIVAPLVLTRTTRYLRSGDSTIVDIGTQIGGVVRGADGALRAGVLVALADSAADGSLSDGDGEFRLARVPSGAVSLRVTPPDGPPRTVTIAVPGTSYDIILP